MQITADIQSERGLRICPVRQMAKVSFVFSLWVGGKIWIASSPDGPFAVMPKATYPGGNPAPVYHDGAFYLTNQKTTEIYTTKTLGKELPCRPQGLQTVCRLSWYTIALRCPRVATDQHGPNLRVANPQTILRAGQCTPKSRTPQFLRTG